MKNDRFHWMRHHPYETTSRAVGFSTTSTSADRALVARIAAAFKRVDPWASYGADSPWLSIAQSNQREVFDVLARDDLDAIAGLLSRPSENYLFYGFEDVYRGRKEWYKHTPGAAQGYADRCHDLLIRLAEAIGALRVENPEGGSWGENLHLSPDDVMHLIESAFGIDISPPRVFGDVCGLQTRSGIITERLINGLYGAWRVRQLVGDKPDATILEIGAGLGWLAYYSYKLGMVNYTIVDLPLTNVSQAYFLGAALGADKITLAGEKPMPGQIRIGTTGAVQEGAPERYSLVVNMDSLTEVGKQVAEQYWALLGPRCSRFLSINHEVNSYTTKDIVAAGPKPRFVFRQPYWLRNGYVEELMEM